VASKARKAFDDNAKDIKRLLEIHQQFGGEKQGRRRQLEVLNKSGIVLITSFWEAYCEDLAAEALNHIITHAPDADVLSKDIKKRIAKNLKDETNEIGVWKLAGEGWRKLLGSRFEDLRKERNWNLNNPKSNKIDDLFLDAIGLKKISDAWLWKRMTAPQACSKLDNYVTLRGAIAHRGKAAKSCWKVNVEDYFNHVNLLVSKTGGHVNKFVKDITGKPLWRKRIRLTNR